MKPTNMQINAIHHSQAPAMWSAMLTYVKKDSEQAWSQLQGCEVLSFDGKTLDIEVSEEAIKRLDQARATVYLHSVAGLVGLPDVYVRFHASKPTQEPPSPSYYLVTDACTGEHLGFPSISLIEAHLKLAGIGPEWPAVALLAHRMGDKGGNHLLWQASERGARKGHPVKLLQVGKE